MRTKRFWGGILLTTVLVFWGSVSWGAERVVMTGSYDSIEKILDELGWAYELVNESQQVDYNLAGVKQLYINCGANVGEESFQQKIKDFVESGGYLYASDLACDTLRPWGLTFDESGESQTTLATVEDPGLRGYIQSELKGGKLEILYDMGSWAMITDYAGAGVLLRGDITTWEATFNNMPLALMLNKGKGRIIYTTFHNEPGGIAQPGMKKAVEYFAMAPNTAAAADKLLEKYGLSLDNLIAFSANSLKAAGEGGIMVQGVPAGSAGKYLLQITDTFLSATALKNAQNTGVLAASGFTVDLYKGTQAYGSKTVTDSDSVVFDVPAADNDGADWTFKVKDSSGYGDMQNVVAVSWKGQADDPVPVDILPTQLNFTISGNQIKVGETKNVLVTFTPANTTARALSWVVEKPSLLTVTKSSTADMYLVKGLAEGETKLTATSTAASGVSKELSITVTTGDDSDKKRDSSGGCDSLGFGVIALFALIGIVTGKNH